MKHPERSNEIKLSLNGIIYANLCYLEKTISKEQPEAFLSEEEPTTKRKNADKKKQPIIMRQIATLSLEKLPMGKDAKLMVPFGRFPKGTECVTLPTVAGIVRLEPGILYRLGIVSLKDHGMSGKIDQDQLSNLSHSVNHIYSSNQQVMGDLSLEGQPTSGTVSIDVDNLYRLMRSNPKTSDIESGMEHVKQKFLKSNKYAK